MRCQRSGVFTALLAVAFLGERLRLLGWAGMAVSFSGALAFTTYAVWAGTLLSLVFLPGLISQTIAAPAGATIAMVYLGVFSTAVAYVTYAYAFSRMPASRAVSFLYLIPVMACLFAWVWLGEVPTFLSVVGGCVTLSGVLIVNTFGGRR